ncbi:NF-kappa-B inhibitor cactus-like [Cydia pomonella]|uniref:NF-kappa-B inhibitor cactus-like n=1 Tax=Cydia pomonella TaxID=82600 RepID=UPI002ADD612A|nr:NF-kappa-B inhibitor cactus-like [Cydia pomonella]
MNKAKTWRNFLCHGDITNLMFLHDVIDNDSRHCLLEYNNKQQQCVHIVASEPNAVEKMKLLVLWGANINGKEGKNGDTALHIGVKMKDYELVEWLCRLQDINRELVNNECRTPFHIAFMNRDEKMMRILKENGATGRLPLQSESNSADEDYEPHKISLKHV